MKVAELEGAMLDYWTAKAEGHKVDALFPHFKENFYIFVDGEWMDYCSPFDDAATKRAYVASKFGDDVNLEANQSPGQPSSTGSRDTSPS